MKTFKNWLIENGVEDELTISQDIIDLYHKHFNEMPLDKVLARSTETEYNNVVFRQTRERFNKSLGGSLKFQEWLFSIGDFKNLPRRSHSIFCTTDDEGDYMFGSYSYRIIPKNGTKLAVWHDEDFNTTSVVAYDNINVDEVNDTLRSMYYELDEDLKKQILLMCDGTNPFTSSAIIKNYNLIQSIIGRFGMDMAEQVSSPEAIHLIQAFMDPEEYFASPELCKAVTPATMNTVDNKPHEVWFEGEYLMIPEELWQKFKREVNKI